MHNEQWVTRFFFWDFLIHKCAIKICKLKSKVFCVFPNEMFLNSELMTTISRHCQCCHRLLRQSISFTLSPFISTTKLSLVWLIDSWSVIFLGGQTCPAMWPTHIILSVSKQSLTFPCSLWSSFWPRCYETLCRKLIRNLASLHASGKRGYIHPGISIRKEETVEMRGEERLFGCHLNWVCLAKPGQEKI